MSAGLPLKQRTAFFRDLAQLTAAGVPISQAVNVLGNEWRSDEVKAAMARMKAGLAAGRTIADALSSSLTAMEHSIIQAAERGGKLEAGFRHLEQYYQLLDQTRARVRGALLYPLFMLHAAVLLPVMVGGVIAGHGPEAILISLLLGVAGIWGGLALLWWGGRWLGQIAATSTVVDQALGLVPLIGTARKRLALARWHAVVHFNIASSQRISDGLREAGRAAGGALLERASQRAAQAVDEGTELGPALTAESAFPREMSGALAAAEFSGTLDHETLRLSRAAMAEAAGSMETSSRWLCGGFYGLVMLFTAWQILRVASGYFGIYQRLLDDL